MQLVSWLMTSGIALSSCVFTNWQYLAAAFGILAEFMLGTWCLLYINKVRKARKQGNYGDVSW